MKLAKLALIFVVVMFLVVIGWLMTRETNTGISQLQNDDFENLEKGKSLRGDDPLYAEEVKKNTALTLKTRDEQRKLSDELKDTVKLIEQKTNKERAALKRKSNELDRKLDQLKTSAPSDNSEIITEYEKRLNEMSDLLAQVNTNLKESSIKNKAAIQEIKDEYAARINESLLQNDDSSNNKLDQVDVSKPKGELTTGAITYPYGYSQFVNNGSDSSPSLTKGIEDAISSSTFFGNDLSVTQQPGRLPTTSISGNRSKKEEWQTVFPVYTLPPNTVLADSTLLTPMIARVPGAGGNVADPFFFKVEIGAENLAANGHDIPGVSKMIASGYSTGIREQSCARGYIDSLTFIFVDGRIVTHGKATSSAKGNKGDNSSGQKLGYLADKWGKPCIRGRYINNAGDYLASRGAAAFVEAAAQGLGQSQVSTKQDADGNTQAILSGNVWSYVLGQGLSGTASEVADYVRERVAGAFDVVYVEQNQPVQIFLDTMLPIDYDAKARKVNYYTEPQ